MHGNKLEVNKLDRMGHSPMDDAIQNGRMVVVKMLKAKGGKPGDEEKLGARLLYAAAQGNEEEVSRILATGLDPDHRDYDHRY